jgi:uncharacterized protein YjdB
MFRKKYKQLLAAVLSAAMLIGQVQYVNAASVGNDEFLLTEEDSEIIFSEVDEASEAASEASSFELLLDEVLEESSEDASEEASEEASSEDASNEEASEESSEEASEESSEEASSEASSEEALEEQTKVELPEGVTELPETYTLTEAETLIKVAALEKKDVYFSNFADLVEGTDYAKNEVVFLSETKEHAEEVAAAFSGTVKSFENGVAVIDLSESAVTVEAAYSCAFLNGVNLPVVTPNYYFHVEESEELYELAEEVTFEDEASEEVSEEATDVAAEETSEAAAEEAANEYQWHLKMVDTFGAWELMGAEDLANTSEVTVAVIDTGIAANPELNLVNAADAEGNHGTLVAGVIAAKKNANGGAGIAPGSKLLNLKSDLTAGSVMAQLHAAVDAKADIVNMSFAGANTDPQFAFVVDEVYAAGITMVAAMGNDKDAAVVYPAAFDKVIAVAAVDEDGKLSSFSGNAAYCDIAAPGTHIWSTDVTDYAMVSGTSVAASVVSGACALYMAKYGHVDPVVMKDLLVASADAKEGLEAGAGIVNVSKLLGAQVTATTAAAGAVSSVKLDKTKATLYIGGKIKVTPSFFDKSKNRVSSACTWKSSNGKVAVVDQSGNITAIKKGKATITCTAQGKKASIAVTVKKKVDSISFSGKNYSKYAGVFYASIGGSCKITSKVNKDASSKALTWTVSPANAGVSVTKAGLVKVAKTVPEGTTVKITATAKDGQGCANSCTVKVVRKSTSVAVTSNNGKKSYNLGTVAKGKLGTGANVTVDAGNGSIVNFKNSNSKVVKISQSGNTVSITALKKGNATVTAAAADGSGKKVAIKVKVVVPVMAISLTPSNGAGRLTDAVCTGASFKFKPTVVGANGAAPSSKKLKYTIAVQAGSTVLDAATAKKVATVSGGKISTKSNGISYLINNGYLADNSIYSSGYSNRKLCQLSGAVVQIKAEATDGSGTYALSSPIFINQRVTKFGFPQGSRFWKVYLQITKGKTEKIASVSNLSEYTSTCSPVPFTVTSSNDSICTGQCVADGNLYILQLTGKKSGTCRVTIKAKDGSGKSSSTEVRVR